MSLTLHRNMATACCLAIALTSPGRGQVTPATKAPDGSTWSQVISADDLQTEVTAIRKRMSSKLATVGSYNRSYLELRIDASSLALLAHAASQHDASIPWKKQAPSVVALARQIVEITDSRSARGRKSQQANIVLFDQLCRLLDGNGDSKDEVQIDKVSEYSDFAPYEHLMKRSESVLSWLQPALKKPDELASRTDLAVRELRIIALNASVLTAEDYGYSDDEEFAGYAKSLRDGATAAAEAAKDGDLAQLKQRIGAMTKSCIQCHAAYRNG